jgi:hypothetical protein
MSEPSEPLSHALHEEDRAIAYGPKALRQSAALWADTEN